MIETKHWLIEGRNEWLQLTGKYNWFTWTIFRLEFEKENMTYGYELIFIVLGLGIRIRYNTDKSLEQFEEWDKEAKKEYDKKDNNS